MIERVSEIESRKESRRRGERKKVREMEWYWESLERLITISHVLKGRISILKAYIQLA